MHGVETGETGALEDQGPAARHSFLYGVDLFNHGFFWEAHAAWEVLWRSSRNRLLRDALKGLIQFSAAMLKLRSGEADGSAKLFRKAIVSLGGTDKRDVKGPLQGIDISEVSNAAEELLLGRRDSYSIQIVPSSQGSRQAS